MIKTRGEGTLEGEAVCVGQMLMPSIPGIWHLRHRVGMHWTQLLTSRSFHLATKLACRHQP